MEITIIYSHPYGIEEGRFTKKVNPNKVEGNINGDFTFDFTKNGWNFGLRRYNGKYSLVMYDDDSYVSYVYGLENAEDEEKVFEVVEK